MSIVNIKIDQNFNHIAVKKKDLAFFEEELNLFQKRWKNIIELFDGRFFYVKENPKQKTYFFFQDKGEQIDISSNNYVNKSDLPYSFSTNFVRFLSKAEDNEDFFEYSLGLKYKTGLDPFDESFYSDFFNLTKNYGEILFTTEITSSDVEGFWESNYYLVDGGISIDSTYFD